MSGVPNGCGPESKWEKLTRAVCGNSGKTKSLKVEIFVSGLVKFIADISKETAIEQIKEFKTHRFLNAPVPTSAMWESVFLTDVHILLHSQIQANLVMQKVWKGFVDRLPEPTFQSGRREVLQWNPSGLSADKHVFTLETESDEDIFRSPADARVATARFAAASAAEDSCDDCPAPAPPAAAAASSGGGARGRGAADPGPPLPSPPPAAVAAARGGGAAPAARGGGGGRPMDKTRRADPRADSSNGRESRPFFRVWRTHT